MSELIPQLVSTIIPVFNRPRMLNDAVRSVLAQTYRPIEILIADDGSTDDTSEVISALAAAHPEMIRSCRIANSGPGPAREAGRQLARGEYLQYLDSDDRLLPNKFADQVEALNANPDCDIAYGMTRLMDETGKVLADPFKWTDRNIPYLFPGLLVDRWWCTHTPLYRRSLTDRIGSWCDMRWSQDWEYDARAGALRARLVNCGTHVSEHLHHAGERQTSGAAWTTDPVRLRNRVQLMAVLWKHGSSTQLDSDAPEKQHFARWCFSIARQCAVQNMRHETETVLQIAESAAGGGSGRRGIGSFRTAIRFAGLRTAGRLFRQLETFRKATSRDTMEQAFARH